MSLGMRFGCEISELLTGQLAQLPALDKYLVFTLIYFKGCLCEKHFCPGQRSHMVCSQETTLHMRIESYLC